MRMSLLLWIALSLPAAAQPYGATTDNTTTGKRTLRVSGRIDVAVSSATPSTPTISLDGTTGISAGVPLTLTSTGTFSAICMAGNCLADWPSVAGIDTTLNLDWTGFHNWSSSAAFANGVYSSTAGFFGPGSGITALNASNIASGTLANARLPASPVFTTVQASTVNAVDAFTLNGATVSFVPTGGILIWTASTNCPAGYTEVTELRAKFPVGADILGATSEVPDTADVAGGATQHQHGINLTRTAVANTGTVYGGENTTYTGYNTTTTYPPFVTVIFCKSTGAPVTSTAAAYSDAYLRLDGGNEMSGSLEFSAADDRSVQIAGDTGKSVSIIPSSSTAGTGGSSYIYGATGNLDGGSIFLLPGGSASRMGGIFADLGYSGAAFNDTEYTWIARDTTGANIVRISSSSFAIRGSTMVVTAGRVGIGTTAPSYQLEVSSYVKAGALCLGATCNTSWPVGVDSTAKYWWTNNQTWSSSATFVSNTLSVGTTMLMVTSGGLGLGAAAGTYADFEVKSNMPMGGKIYANGNITSANGGIYTSGTMGVNGNADMSVVPGNGTYNTKFYRCLGGGTCVEVGRFLGTTGALGLYKSAPAYQLDTSSSARIGDQLIVVGTYTQVAGDFSIGVSTLSAYHGNVYIGTTTTQGAVQSPGEAMLSIYGKGLEGDQLILGVGRNENSQVTFIQSANVTDPTGMLSFIIGRSSCTPENKCELADGDQTGALYFSGYIAGGDYFGPGGGIIGEQVGTPLDLGGGEFATKHNLHFFTMDPSGTMIQPLNINTTGYVGIGTTAPTAPLTVVGQSKYSVSVDTGVAPGESGRFGHDENYDWWASTCPTTWRRLKWSDE